MFKKIMLSNENLDYNSKDYLSKTKLNSLRIHIFLQMAFSIFLMGYSIIFKFKPASVYGQATIFIGMVIAYILLLKDRSHKRAALFLSVFYTVVVFPSVSYALGSFHVLPVMMCLYSVILIIILLEGKPQIRMLGLNILISVFISIKDYREIAAVSGSDIAFNRYVSLMLAFILISMTVWVFKDTVVLLSNENYKNSVIDRLTGVFNYFSFEKELKKSINIYNRHDENFSIAMIDIDNFKILNDSYGHQDGDAFLKVFVDHAKKYIRQEDFLARYGGDEFIILFPRSNKELAVKVIDRLYKESLSILEDYKELDLSFSCGICDYNEAIHLEEDVVKLADSRMYKAKEQGKNKYIA